MKIDKEKLLTHITDEQVRSILVKILDQAQKVIYDHQAAITDFYEPHIVKHASGILVQIPDLLFKTYGGYEEAERKRILIIPDYLVPEWNMAEIGVLQISGNSTFINKLSHRDFLGSILGLGIKREKIGDLLLQGDICQVILDKNLLDYIKHNLEKVGKVKVFLEEIEQDNIKPPKAEIKEIVTTISSLRLDNIIAAGFNISRQAADALIAGEKVKTNWQLVTNKSLMVSEGDLISCRNQGRIKIVDILGETKKGRLKIKINKFL